MSFCPKCGTDVVDGARFCPTCGNSLPQRPAAPDDPYLGRVIDNKFRMDQLLGIGGMGRVYKANQLSLDKVVCVKVLRSGGDDETLARRFHREARAASRLNHPNSITVIDFGQAPEDGALYLAMEFVPGKDLSKVVSQEFPLSTDRIVHIMDQVLSALADAHAAGIVHRDLKPENIMVTDLRGTKDFVKVLDFGIAKVQEQEQVDPGLTQAGMVCGTPEYMSPEQARGEELDARSDLYAAGVILYQCVTGRLPFIAPTAMGIVTKHLVEPPTPPSQVKGVTCPPALEAVILKAMSKDRNGRQATALVLQQELAAVRSPVVAPAQQSPQGNELFSDFEAGATVLRDATAAQAKGAPPKAPGRLSAAGGSKKLLVAALVSFLVAGAAMGIYFLLSAPEPPATEAAVPAPVEQPDAGTVAAVDAGVSPKKEPAPPADAGAEKSPPVALGAPAGPAVAEEPKIPDSARMLYTAGKEFMAREKPSKAIESLKRAVKLFPAYADAHKALGTCYMSTGAFDSAREHFEQYLKLRPNAPDRPVIQSLLDQF